MGDFDWPVSRVYRMADSYTVIPPESQHQRRHGEQSFGFGINPEARDEHSVGTCQNSMGRRHYQVHAQGNP
jgi:hypothetical protein